MEKSHVLIAGGGIGGLVAALALNQRGFDVSLYEQAPELHELGAGVMITPNGSRVLCALGHGDDRVRATQSRHAAVQYRTDLAPTNSRC